MDLIEAAINFLILPSVAFGILLGGGAGALASLLHNGDIVWVWVAAGAAAGGILNPLLFRALEQIGPRRTD